MAVGRCCSLTAGRPLAILTIVPTGAARPEGSLHGRAGALPVPPQRQRPLSGEPLEPDRGALGTEAGTLSLVKQGCHVRLVGEWAEDERPPVGLVEDREVPGHVPERRRGRRGRGDAETFDARRSEDTPAVPAARRGPSSARRTTTAPGFPSRAATARAPARWTSRACGPARGSRRRTPCARSTEQWNRSLATGARNALNPHWVSSSETRVTTLTKPVEGAVHDRTADARAVHRRAARGAGADGQVGAIRGPRRTGASGRGRSPCRRRRRRSAARSPRRRRPVRRHPCPGSRRGGPTARAETAEAGPGPAADVASVLPSSTTMNCVASGRSHPTSTAPSEPVPSRPGVAASSLYAGMTRDSETRSPAPSGASRAVTAPFSCPPGALRIVGPERNAPRAEPRR